MKGMQRHEWSDGEEENSRQSGQQCSDSEA